MVGDRIRIQVSLTRESSNSASMLVIAQDK